MPREPDVIDKPHHVRLMLAIRQQHGWTQQDLAQQLQVSKRTVIRWENDQQDPPIYLLAALRELVAVGSGA